MRDVGISIPLLLQRLQPTIAYCHHGEAETTQLYLHLVQTYPKHRGKNFGDILVLYQENIFWEINATVVLNCDGIYQCNFPLK